MKTSSLLSGKSVAVLVVILSLAYSAGAHCQIPCGIYGDELRVKLIQEHLDTVSKSMKQIESLSAVEHPNFNQMTRWVMNKDKHADEIAHLITYYFMAQRIKPTATDNAEAYTKYVKELTLLHQMLVSAMKAKQSTDLAHVEACQKHLTAFSHSYFGH
jgi:nickel superoxide dismutase